MKRVRLDPTRSALLVIDVQNDFCASGTLEVKGGEEVVPIINNLMPHFGQVFLTQDWHPRGHLSFASSHTDAQPFQEIETPYGRQTLWPDHCIQGTRGADTHPLLLTHPVRTILRKGMNHQIDSYSAFFENDRKTSTGLGGLLTELGIRELFLAGLATDFCVLYSAMDARRLGFDVVLVQDACRAVDREDSLQRALNQMGKAGVLFARSRQIV
ncbi:MAG: bifunctional nicotinamidase/pyrazinamidase [Candidatus Eisenbacteria sp.]|nr:bifunctional nicotinamidase/pyrazinamidase [Candidatus Eisenbacteria bacterium]